MMLTIRSFAKINLTLDVFSVLPSGYHGMASVMQTISLCDTLDMSLTPQIAINFSCQAPLSPDVPVGGDNLVVKAVSLLLNHASSVGKQVEYGINLQLTKSVPSQAGLGGGSSNAAAALTGVNSLLQLGFSREELAVLAAELGSDVPFFLYGGTALAMGRGTEITTLPDIPTLWMVVVKPVVAVSTKWAYQQLDALENRSSHRASARMQQAIATGDRDRILTIQCNDFEAPVLNHYKDLAWLADEMRMAGARIVHLAGSGSALYGIADDQAAAISATERLKRVYPHTWTARTLTRSEAS
jgi:4-diphosphocytidyl-2-C-methyl-D-erythritol kinase